MLIWSYKKITELNGRTGFVDCEKDLAEKLIADGHAQSLAGGANTLKRIENTNLVAAYEVAIKEKTTKKRKASNEGDK
jgi:hypothetical protein